MQTQQAIPQLTTQLKKQIQIQKHHYQTNKTSDYVLFETSHFYIDQQQILWVATMEGLYRKDLKQAGKQAFERYPFTQNDTHPYCIYPDSTAQTLWIGANVGLYAFDLVSKTFRYYSFLDKNGNLITFLGNLQKKFHLELSL